MTETEIDMKIIKKYHITNDPDILAELENGNWLWLFSYNEYIKDTDAPGWAGDLNPDVISNALENGPFWTAPTDNVSTSNLPKNNDGLDKCAFCGAPTRTTGGYIYGHDYRVCTGCGR